jgi:hypothetical protein
MQEGGSGRIPSNSKEWLYEWDDDIAKKSQQKYFRWITSN